MNYDAALKRISDMTERNQHTEAYIAGCEFLRKYNPKVVKGMDHVIHELEINMSKHERLGHLTPRLKTERDYLYNDMMETARVALDPDLFEKFHMCF